jgi:hypothetical protein
MTLEAKKQVTKTEAVGYFLRLKTHPDLAGLYNASMEVQMSVAQDGGDKIQKEFRGRQYAAYTDGRGNEWKSFRIPLNANSEPEDNDGEMLFNLEAHVEGIGLTGWDWRNRVSRYCGFDFDGIAGHAEGHRGKLTDEELAEVKKKAMEIPWVTVRKSTGGNGIHLYVFLPDVPTANHTEHAALARAVLGQMSAVVGYDFQAKVDAVGVVLWVWHRKMRGTDGLALLKQGEVLKDIPPNWREHVPVVTGKRRKALPAFVAESGTDDLERTFEELTGQRNRVPLDEDHRKLTRWLEEHRFACFWNADHHMLQTHTRGLQEAHKALGLKGAFITVSPGSDPGIQNCFCFPDRDGAWVVRRYSQGVREDVGWDSDRMGYARCYFNRELNLPEAARVCGGAEVPSGGFQFHTAREACEAAKLLGADVQLPAWALGRATKLRVNKKDGRLIVDVPRVEKEDNPAEMRGWEMKRQTWSRIYDVQASKPAAFEVGDHDNLVRHLVTEGGEDAGWVLRADGQWIAEPLAHVQAGLASFGYNKDGVKRVVGSAIVKPWTLITRPFQPEFPGDRAWNRGAAQFVFPPAVDLARLSYPHWTRILNHLGKGLDDAVKASAWCRDNGIASGADYLKCWLASLFQYPHRQLPYLFFYSLEQDTGKSTLHEAVELVIANGCQRADNALTSVSGFNGELKSAVVCVVEETNLRAKKETYNRIKDWVTSLSLPIHEKGRTPYKIPNTTHWIQCANERDACPVFHGDTRITMIRVEPLDPTETVPKEELMRRLRAEGPDFLAEVLALELPPPPGRLGIPVVESREKRMLQDANRTALERFCDEHNYYVPGAMISQADFWDRFQKSLDADEKAEWTKTRVGQEMPERFPKGKSPKDRQNHFGNIAWEQPAAGATKLAKLVVTKDGTLIPETRATAGQSVRYGNVLTPCG